eukprot:13981_1
MLSGNERGMKCTIDGTVYPSFTENTWFGDSGASCHIDYEDEDMFDVVYIDEVVGGIGDQLLRATKKGKKRVKIQQADGSSMEKVLNPVKYCAKAKEKLFSITRELSEGAKLASDANNNIILLYDDGTKIVFDRRIKTHDGWVGGVHISPVVDETVNVATVATKTVVQYHRELGHPSEMTTRSTAKARGEKLGGTFTQCKECVLSKAKQKKVSKDSVERSKTPGGRLFIDISSPKTKSIGGSKHWLLVVDDCSDNTFSFFLKKKSDQYDVLIGFVKDLKAKHGMSVRNIRCDNAGENTYLEKMCKREGLGITFEYTAPDTPQQNGRVERKFATLYGRVRAMLSGSGIDNPLRKKLWTEAANTATQLDNILVPNGKSINSFQQFFGKGIKSPVNSTKVFGEMCVVSDRRKIKAKFDDRGKTGIWLGYAEGHAVGTYRVYNPETKKVILSRDVTFIHAEHENKSAEAVPKSILSDIIDDDSDDDIPGTNVVSDSESDDDDDDDMEDATFHTAGDISADEDDDEVVPSPETTINPRVLREMRKLDASYNPEAREIISNTETGRETEETDAEIEAEIANLMMIDIAKVADQTDTTEYVDIRYKYVNEYVEDGVIKIIFVKSGDNDSDIMTKNLGGDLYSKHSN